MNEEEKNIEDKLKQAGKNLREIAFPDHCLCKITFDDGYKTNDFIPNEILDHHETNPVDWFNKNKKDEFIPLMKGETKVISVAILNEE